MMMMMMMIIIIMLMMTVIMILGNLCSGLAPAGRHTGVMSPLQR